jgi:hypothetical protein
MKGGNSAEERILTALKPEVVEEADPYMGQLLLTVAPDCA